MVKASTKQDSGSGFQETNLGNWVLILEADRSISGTPHLLAIWKNTDFFRVHSVLSLNSLDSLSASQFCTPAIWAAVIQIFLDMQKHQISLAISLQQEDFVPLIAFM